MQLTAQASVLDTPARQAECGMISAQHLPHHFAHLRAAMATAPRNEPECKQSAHYTNL